MSHPEPLSRNLQGLVAVIALAVVSATATTASGETPEEAFLSENAAAMSRMMAAMDIKPAGDIDRDFVAMMIPHHQGAVDMAVAELRYGRNEQLRRIAQAIVVNQPVEISAMQLVIGESVAPSASSTTGYPATGMQVGKPGANP